MEDDADIRALVRFCLQDDERCGEVLEAVSPSDAVLAAAAATRPIGTMVVDFALTDGTAADCMGELRALHPDAWIVVYTANRSAAESAGVLALGADVLVEKVSSAIDEIVDLALSGGQV